MLSFPARFPLKFSHFFYLNIICLLIPIFCFADNSVEQIIRDRLSKDKKTLDLSGTKISFKCCKTLQDGVGWYAHQYPELPNDIYYYLTRTTMGFPVTPEEISKNKKLRKRFLRKKLKAKAKQYTKTRGDFTVKFK